MGRQWSEASHERGEGYWAKRCSGVEAARWHFMWTPSKTNAPAPIPAQSELPHELAPGVLPGVKHFGRGRVLVDEGVGPRLQS